MIHLGTRRLETERLILRRFEEKDVQAMFDNWETDGEVTRFLRWLPACDIEETYVVLARWIADYKKPESYQWAIVPKELGKPIGSISAVDMDDRTEMVHIGYCIGRKWWHQGYTSEAMARVIDFFFDEVGVNRIESQHDPRNPNSGMVMRKCGMTYEGTLRQADWNNQGICDACIYSILKQDRK